MSNYDLIAFDMDGTLLNSDKEISPLTKKALEKAANAGKTITLSTGRCLPELTKYFTELPMLRYVICVSGALVYDVLDEKIIYSQTVPEEIVDKLFAITEDLDVMVHTHSIASITEKNKIPMMDLYNMGIYRTMFEKVATGVDDIRKYYKENRYPVFKFNIYPRSPEERPGIHKLIEQLPITVAYAESASLECSALGISKASGLKYLCDSLGIPISRSIAVGDAGNDLDILKVAGLSVAMGNSIPEVLSIADKTVADNDHDGCAEAIERFLL